MHQTHHTSHPTHTIHQRPSTSHPFTLLLSIPQFHYCSTILDRCLLSICFDNFCITILILVGIVFLILRPGLSRKHPIWCCTFSSDRWYMWQYHRQMCNLHPISCLSVLIITNRVRAKGHRGERLGPVQTRGVPLPAEPGPLKPWSCRDFHVDDSD